MTDETTRVDQGERAVQAAARVVAWAALDLIQQDPHQWSKRPCPTCRAVTALLHRPFGCMNPDLTR